MAGAYYHRSVDYFAGVLTGYMISGPSCVFINLNNSFLKYEKIILIVEMVTSALMIEFHGNTNIQDLQL